MPPPRRVKRTREVELREDYANFITDAEDRITDWLPGAAAVFGWSAEEVVGQSAAILFTPEDREAGQPEKEIETARREDYVPNTRWHLRKDGSRVFIEGSVRALQEGRARRPLGARNGRSGRGSSMRDWTLCSCPQRRSRPSRCPAEGEPRPTASTPSSSCASWPSVLTRGGDCQAQRCVFSEP